MRKKKSGKRKERKWDSGRRKIEKSEEERKGRGRESWRQGEMNEER